MAIAQLVLEYFKVFLSPAVIVGAGVCPEVS